jgi:hypothetical protein
METIFGTNFSLTLGSWRLSFNIAVDDIDAPVAKVAKPPHHVRIIREHNYSQRKA